MAQQVREQLPLPFEQHTVSLGAEDFLVAPSNRVAADWIGRWPDWPFDTLMLVGPPGSGKSHLAGLWRERAGAVAIDPRGKGLEEVAAQVAAGAGRVLVDDSDRVAGDDESELALLQLYNLVRAAGGRLLLTAGRPPSEWPVDLPDLASRLAGAMVARLDPPDDTLLAAVAVKLFRDRQLQIGQDVVPVLLERGERSFAGIARAIDALDRHALEHHRNVDARLVRKVLAEPQGESYDRE